MEEEYKVLVSNGSSNLTSQVNLYLKEGWMLVGGTSVTNYYVPSKNPGEDDKLVFQYVQAVSRLSDELPG